MSMLRPLNRHSIPKWTETVAVSFTLSSYINSKPTCRYDIISKAHTGQIRILTVFIDLEF